MTNWSRDPRRPGRVPVFFSITLHAVVIVAAWWVHRQSDPRLEYITYEMHMVSMADLEAVAPPEQELVIETPEPELPQPEPEVQPEAPLPEPVPEPEPPPPEPDPIPDPVPPREDPPVRQPPPEPTRETAPPREETTEAAAANVAVRMEGVRRDFPAYYQNIVTQIQRCFRASGSGNWTTTILFEIERDGTVRGSNIRIERRSGSTPFDIQAMGAVECAGTGRFGPLPDELPFDQLPIRFTFTPSGAAGGGG